MRLLLYNGATGRLEEFRPAVAPQASVDWRCSAEDGGLSSFRLEAFRSFFLATLDYLGFRASAPRGPGADLVCSPSEPPEAAFWLRPSGVEGDPPAVPDILARGFDPLDLRLFCLLCHYRRPLRFDWEALEAARGERQGLIDAARRLRARPGASAPNAAGLAGYKKRFRDALAADLDGAKAVGVVWDALRPGALSAGSQSEVLSHADGVLGLLRLG